MARKKKYNRTTREIANKVDYEGLSYAIMSYMSSDDFEDRHLAKLWTDANVLLKEIEAILEESLAGDSE